LSGAISGVGSLTKDGLGTLILKGVNTYSGATNVAVGTLQAGSSIAFSANSAFTRYFSAGAKRVQQHDRFALRKWDRNQ
jgi:autotransporter-associated beta strand protein